MRAESKQTLLEKTMEAEAESVYIDAGHVSHRGEMALGDWKWLSNALTRPGGHQAAASANRPPLFAPISTPPSLHHNLSPTTPCMAPNPRPPFHQSGCLEMPRALPAETARCDICSANQYHPHGRNAQQRASYPKRTSRFGMTEAYWFDGQQVSVLLTSCMPLLCLVR